MSGEYEWIKQGLSIPPVMRLIIISAIVIFMALIPTEGISEIGLQIYGIRVVLYLVLGVGGLLAFAELISDYTGASP